MNAGAATGDRVRVSVSVRLAPAEAFRVFTEDVDLWWRRGPKYRVSGRVPGVLQFEPGVGGRLLESFASPAGPRAVETGRVTVWDPPSRLAFEWRGVNFAPGEATAVDVRFEPTAEGTSVTVVHSGWSTLRADHPVRHGLPVAGFLRMTGLWWGELLTSMREHVGGTRRA